MKKMKHWHNKIILLTAFPGLGMFLFFIVLPFLASARYSFLNDVYHRAFAGLDNFRNVIGNKYFRLAFRNSFRFAVVGVALLLLLATLLALALHRLKRRTGLLRILFAMPVLVPTAGIVLAWHRVFRQMYYYDLMKNPVLSDFWYILPIYLIYLWKHTGLCILVLLAAIDHIPDELYEAAKLDGASRGVCTRRITLPLMRPNLLLALMYAFMSSLKIFKESYFYYGETKYPNDIAYTLQYYMNNHFLKMNYPTLSVATLLFTATIAVIVFMLYRAEGRFSEALGGQTWN
ncbi:MAG: sugar ABC transporter permease [Lachnospiraceae bacterium]|nr:sugar ABC transporter permease [Lachnospiraceae bacterium]